MTSLRTIGEHMADTSQHFVWVADEVFAADDNGTWQGHCSCGWAGTMTNEGDACAETVAHQEALGLNANGSHLPQDGKTTSTAGGGTE